MQKKLLAMAVAGLVSMPVFAQSNVTIYGILDYALNYQRDGNGNDKRYALDADGNWTRFGSRIGFRGVEDLGNGLKASFVLEGGFEGDTGRSAQGGRLFGRQAFGALSGNFGTLAFGRQYSPQYTILATVDPFEAGYAANVAATYRIDWRLDNTVAYVSPSWSGFNVTAAYSFNADGQEVAKDDGNARVWAISPVYNNGPLYLAANYHQIKSDASGSEKVKVWDLGGMYDFGPAKLHLVGGKRKFDGTASEAAYDFRNYMVGVSVPVTAVGSIMASYTYTKEKESNNKANQWGIGYRHDLSKRTSLYTSFAKRGKDYKEIYNPDLGDPYEKQFQVGVSHTF